MAETNNLDDLPRGLQIDTTTYNPIPEDALPNEIENVAKIMLGPGSAGLGEPEDGTMKGYQFFRDQYLPEKVKQLSENFGYSEDEIYGMINTRLREYVGSPGKPKMAKGGQVKRVGLRGGGRDASQDDFGAPDFGGYDSGGYDPAPAPTSPQMTEITIGDAPTVFDITKVGDPSQNPNSINVRGGINYTPSFTPKPSFVQKAVTKGKNFVKFVSPFLVNAAFGTFVPSKVKKGLALINLVNNLDVIADKSAQDTLEEDMAISPDGRTEFRGGGKYQGVGGYGRGRSTRAKAPPSMGFGNPPPGKKSSGVGGDSSKTKTKKPTIVDKGKAILNVPLQFGKGLFGNLKNPGALTKANLTAAQRKRLNEIIQSKGTSKGTIDYSDYGSPTETFSGIKGMSPMDASLATTFGGGSFSIDSKGNITLGGDKYDFGSGSNNPITNFINQGGFMGTSLGKGIYNLGGKIANLKDGGQPKKIPIRSNKYGVKELDYRKSGGFVPIGVKEKADDVPAMLSKNEFVFTADAVRGAGGGSINKGAQRMYNLMKNLEARKA